MSLGQQNLPQIQKSFQHVVPVGVCYNNTQPYVEKEYTYPVSNYRFLLLDPRADFPAFLQNFAQYAAGTTSISLAAPTAVSTDASLSIPLSTGISSGASVTSAIGYQSAAAAASGSSGSSSKGTNAAGRGASVQGGIFGAVVVGALGAGVLAVVA